MNPAELKEAYRYCENITRKHAKSFYFANKFLPKDKQQAVYALYALCRHIDDEVDGAEVESDAEAVAAVARWKSQLDSIYVTGSAKKPHSSESMPIGSEMVFAAWEDLLRNYDIPRKHPLDLMKGVLMDTYLDRYETFDDLYVYCYRVASTVGLMSTEILGYSDASTLEYAEALGIAMQLTNILRDVREDAAMGRIYIPREDLKRFGVSEEQIFANTFDKSFGQLVAFQIERAREYYRIGEKGIRLLDRDARFCVLLASRIYAQILVEIERRNLNVFAGRAFTSKSQKLLSVPGIWRESRRL